MNLQLTSTDYLSILPMTILAVFGMLVLLIDLILKPQRQPSTAWLALLGFVAAGAAAVALLNQRATGFGGMIALDPYAQVLGLVAIIAGGLSVLSSFNYIRDRDIGRSEYYALLLFSVSGMVLMASANNLIIVFIALELLSIPLYVLAGFARPNVESEEAALKYFLLGAFASGFLLFGIALTYGALGTTDLTIIAARITEVGSSPMLLLGAGLILTGLGFKVAAVPFHMWTPDVYEGAPTPITGFMSVGAKAAGFAALLRVFVYSLGSLQADWVTLVAIISAVTMIVGNVVAISQTNLKRLLAYSSIAHAGYILIGVAAGNQTGVSGALFYLIAYTFTNIGAFAVLTSMANASGEDQSYQSYRGLYKRSPGLALVMALFMFSLTGIPLTGGFIGKYYLFLSAIEAKLYWLAIIGVLTSVVSAFFYLRVIVDMFMREGEPGHEVQPVRYRALGLTVGLSGLATFLLGVIPTSFLAMVQLAARLLIGKV
jgi:NADH-quinone oxidoreductase subunit N